MKITLSKSQWEFIGKKAGWMKRAQGDAYDPSYDNLSNFFSEMGFSESDRIGFQERKEKEYLKEIKFHVGEKVKWYNAPEFGIGTIKNIHKDDRGYAVYRVDVDPSVGATGNYILARNFEIEAATEQPLTSQSDSKTGI